MIIKKFKIKIFFSKNLSNMNLCVDTKDDLKRKTDNKINQ